MKAVVILCMLLCTACVPVIQHGPWVRDSYSGSIGGSFAVVQEGDAVGDVQPLFSFEGGLRWGFAASDSTSDGFSVGVQIPMLALLAVSEPGISGDSFFDYINLDGYVAQPLTKNLDASFGIAGSSFHTMPYVQLGKYDRWYATQAFMLMSESDAWVWAPSFSFVSRGRGGTRTHFTLTGAVGSDESDVYWMAGFSIIFEMARARN